MKIWILEIKKSFLNPIHIFKVFKDFLISASVFVSAYFCMWMESNRSVSYGLVSVVETYSKRVMYRNRSQVKAEPQNQSRHLFGFFLLCCVHSFWLLLLHQLHSRRFRLQCIISVHHFQWKWERWYVRDYPRLRLWLNDDALWMMASW